MTPPHTSANRGNRGNRGTATPRRATSSRPDLREELNELLLAFEMPFAVAGDQYCSDIIQARGPMLTAALEEAAQKNPTLRRWLERAVTGGSTITCVVCALSIVVPILAHHVPGVPEGDPFRHFFPASPEEAAVRRAMAEQWQAAAAEYARENGTGEGTTEE